VLRAPDDEGRAAMMRTLVLDLKRGAALATKAD